MIVIILRLMMMVVVMVMVFMFVIIVQRLFGDARGEFCFGEQPAGNHQLFQRGQPALVVGGRIAI